MAQKKKNSPVEGEKDLLFLISLLDREDKVEFIKTFSVDLWSLVEEGKLTRTGYNKLLNGIAPSDDRVLQIVEIDEEAKEWIIERVKEKASKALEIIQRMEAEEE
uniref:hypothetical protein n=1 Tax=Sulfolobus sp. NOB8H2 TaxID=84600 RepID=UPI002107E2DD|nr:hypothetical protein [Sulfolobus sp. NOB8H2]